jgi:FAD/FMN-containing dehydrogenase
MLASRAFLFVLLVIVGVSFAAIQLDTSNSARQNAADDYGHIVSLLPVGVVSPSSVQEVVEIVNYANSNGIEIAAVGAAHSTKGTAQALNGIVVNMTNLNQVLSVGSDSAWVEAGATWRSLVEATLPLGLTPPVFTDYIKLSIGGTLAVGGVGSQTPNHGIQLDNVEALEVVTGKGKIVECSPTKKSKLFYAVLGGLGQFGIVTKAKISLIPAKQNVRYVKLLYSDYTQFADDLFVMANGDTYEGVQGFAIENTATAVSIFSGNAFPDQDFPLNDDDDDNTDDYWVYMIEGTAYFNDASEAKPLSELTQGLQPINVDFTDISYFAYLTRLDPVEAIQIQFGSWFLPHPKIDVIVGRAASYDFIPSELAMNTVADVNGVILICPYLASTINVPNFPLPEEDEVLLFALLRAAVPPTETEIDRLLALNTAMYDRTLAVGGVGYAIDSVPLNPESWEVHFGADRYAELLKQKKKYDRNNIFAPTQNVFHDSDIQGGSSSTSTSSSEE